MSEYVILTDSSADLDDALVKALGVEVVPLKFIINGETYSNYPDNREMDPHLFYERLRSGDMATTSAVNVAQYTEALEPLLQAGKDVLNLAYSSIGYTLLGHYLTVYRPRPRRPLCLAALLAGFLLTFGGAWAASAAAGEPTRTTTSPA